ncbi:MAG: aminotransferase class V-fold PLP-dependent enzyme, partial [Euryarchaeota archaeon]|nr:aminotransferase class V-fold PLP-dependent enzyme [Euryarchaeota archaeon]
MSTKKSRPKRQEFEYRTGQHSSQPLMNVLGVPSTNRASFWIYNTQEEAESFISHLRYVC